MMNNKQLTELGEDVGGVSGLPKGWAQSSIGEVVAFNPKTDSLETMECAFSSMHSLGKSFRDKLGFEIKLWGEVKKAYTHFQDGDVLMAKVTPCFENGKAGIADNLPNKIGAGSSEFMVFRPSEAVINRYLLAWLSTNDFRRRATVVMTGSVGLKRVPKDFVLSEQIPLAPLPEQKRIADKLDATLARVDACRERLARVTPLLKRFRQSVLAAATSGQLTADWREQQNGFAAACKADYSSSAAAEQELVGASSLCSTGPTAITADLPTGITDESGNLQNEDCANKETPTSAALHERLASQASNLLCANDEHSECALPVQHNQQISNKSILCEEFGWEIPPEWSLKTIGDIAEVKGGKRLPKGEELTAKVTDFPYIRAGQLKEGTVISDGQLYLMPEAQKQISRYTVDKGDVFITIVGACIGDAGIIPEKYHGANLTENAAKICQFKRPISSEYLACWLRSQPLQDLILGEIKSGAQGKLALMRIKQLPVPYPSIEEQTEIVRRVETLFGLIDRLEARLASANAATKRLTPSLLAKAFRGELVQQDPSDEPASELLKRLAAQREALAKAPKTKRSVKAS